MSTAVDTSVDSLPPELFYEITEDILIEYLHLAILQPEEAGLWNAFVVLPLVSHTFLSFTNSFFVKLFGEAGQKPIEYVWFSLSVAISRLL